MTRFAHPLVVVPLAKLALHFATFRGYGLFRDEFYYIACSRRLAWGYVDHPPLSIALLTIERTLLGESLFALRVLPALAGAATVLMVGLITRELGGGRYAQTLSMIAVGIEFIGVFHVYSMNCFDVLLWATAAFLLARLLQDGDPRLWLVLGTVLGAGLLNKISVLWLGFGLFVALLATAQRRWLRTRWPWAAGLIAAAIFLPHLIWQVRNGWPTLEFIRNATGQKMIEVAPWDFVVGQLSMLGVTVVPIWLAGLAWLLFSEGGRRFRPLGWIYVVVFALLLVSGSSRAGYLGPAYTWLLAAGAVALERWFASLQRAWLQPTAIAAVLVVGIVFAPFSLPVLPVETYVEYAKALGVGPSTEEKKELAELPQHYADRHGWEEIVGTTAEVFRSLPEAERDRAAIFTSNYGVAGAIDHLGDPHGLPDAISGHNNYWLWGPRDFSGEVVIVLGGSEEGHSRRYQSVEHAATIECGYCMPYENHRPIFVLRGPRRPLSEIWPELKHYD